MHHRSQRRSIRRPFGFTLIELMITVVIVAILSALAMNSYTNYVRKGRRADVQGVLLGHTATLERWYTNNNDYSTYAGSFVDPRVSPYYTVAWGTGGEVPTATTFTLVATPIGSQANDGCGTLKITNAGVKTSSGSASNCWQ